MGSSPIIPIFDIMEKIMKCDVYLNKHHSILVIIFNNYEIIIRNGKIYCFDDYEADLYYDERDFWIKL